MRNNLVLWCDLETSGIDPDVEHASVLEVSFELCYPSGKPILEANTPLHWPSAFPISEVWPEHFRSGLMDECRKDGCVRRSDFDVQFATVLERERKKRDAHILLAGSSIHFDRRWIRKWLPYIEKELHYRMIDVRSLILFLQFQGINFRMKDGQDKSTIHRAKADREWAKLAYFAIEDLWKQTVPDTLDYIPRALPGKECPLCGRITPTEMKAVYHEENERFCPSCLQSFGFDETRDGEDLPQELR